MLMLSLSGMQAQAASQSYVGQHLRKLAMRVARLSEEHNFDAVLHANDGSGRMLSCTEYRSCQNAKSLSEWLSSCDCQNNECVVCTRNPRTQIPCRDTIDINGVLHLTVS